MNKIKIILMLAALLCFAGSVQAKGHAGHAKGHKAIAKLDTKLELPKHKAPAHTKAAPKIVEYPAN